MTFFANFKRSAEELKSVRCIAVMAVLIALDLVLKSFLNIQVTDNLKISFAFVAVAALGMLYGPTAAGLACVVTDIVGYLLKPTGTFNPLFTLVEVIGGIIYGCFLYGFSPIKPDLKSVKTFGRSIFDNWSAVLRIVLAKVTVAVVCNLFMTPLFITIQKAAEAGSFNSEVFWTGFLTRVGTRVIKNAIEVPVHILILILVLFPIKAAYNAAFKRRKSIG